MLQEVKTRENQRLNFLKNDQRIDIPKFKLTINGQGLAND